MTHDEAIREQAVERYLLGELSGEARDRFEEHFFDCALCAADLKDASRFVDGLRALPPSAFAAQNSDSAAPAIHAVPRRPLSVRLAPWLGPALAACLLVLAWQNVVVLPGLRRSAASFDQPAVLNATVLANINARGSDVPTLSAPAHGAFVVSVDVPSRPGAASYQCALYDSQGHSLWQVPVSGQQADNTVFLHIPTDKASAGTNELRIFSISADGRQAAEIGRYHFNLNILQ